MKAQDGELVQVETKSGAAYYGSGQSSHLTGRRPNVSDGARARLSASDVVTTDDVLVGSASVGVLDLNDV